MNIFLSQILLITQILLKPSLIFVIQLVIQLQLYVMLKIFQNDKPGVETQKHCIIEFSSKI